MGKKGKKTRWRRLPIGGTDEESGLSLEAPAPQSDPHRHRVTFNEDEYTKITTPRQDVLFKKGYFGRKRTPPNPSPSDTQEVHSGDSVENESYMSEEPQYAYPAPAGFVDPNGVYYVNGNTFETYDPYTGTVTVVVGPPAQYPGAPPVLAALPCQPVPLQPVEWFNPAAAAPWCYSYNRRKRYSTDSQNCSAQSSESTGPPGSPQEPVDEGAVAMYLPPPDHQYVYPGCEVTGCLCLQNCSAQSSESTGPPGSPQEPVDEAAATMYPPPPGLHYAYPGYMFGPPIYNMNGMTVQGMMPQTAPVPPDMTANKRRKKRRRRRRGGVTDDGSESSCCEEPLTCDMTGCQSETSQSGASSDAGVGPNSDSGINTNSGSNSPPLEHQQDHQPLILFSGDDVSPCAQSVVEFVATTPDEVEVSEELSTAEDDVTPNLRAAAPEFSSQESTLSCVSTPSAARDLLPNEQELTNEEVLERCPSVSSLHEVTTKDENEMDVSECKETKVTENVTQPSECLPDSRNNDLINSTEELISSSIKNTVIEEGLSELEEIPPIVVSGCELLEVNNKSVESSENLRDSKTEEESHSIDDELLDKDKEIVAQETVKLSCSFHEDALNSTIEEESESEETIIEREIKDENDTNLILKQENVQAFNHLLLDTEEPSEVEACGKENVYEVEEKIEEVREEVCIMNTAASLNTEIPICYSLPRLSFGSNTLAPVPPPRRKKSLNRAADRVATRVVEDAIKEGLEEAARVRLKNPLSITEAVTRWLNSHESSPLTCLTSDEESDNDEGIEVGEEESTGQKNVRGNPFLASSHSDAGQRVANDCESLSSAGEWDMWDHSHTREMCDPLRSVDRYYRLGADEGVPSVYKTAMHLRHTGPFPCGVCCIIQ